MASDDKKTETSPAPKNETAVKKEAASPLDGLLLSPRRKAYQPK